MSREVKIIVFSLILLISFINKHCNSTSNYTKSNSVTNNTNKDFSRTNNSSSDIDNSSYYPTARPVNGFSPYDSYYGRGVYNNQTSNTIEVTAPLSADIVIMFKNVYTGKTIRNEFIRAGSKFSLTGVPYGNYKFFYLYGNDWSSNADFKGGLAKGNFLKNKGVSKSDKRIDVEFAEGYYGTYTLTLQLLSNGNLNTVSSSENDL